MRTDRHTPMTTRPCGLRRAGKYCDRGTVLYIHVPLNKSEKSCDVIRFGAVRVANCSSCNAAYSSSRSNSGGGGGGGSLIMIDPRQCDLHPAADRI